MKYQDKDFHQLKRSATIADLSKQRFDLIIIGGGITGAGIALDATLRNLKVLLLEKDDYASGTSSKSTKLIHGGLRYLKQFEIGLVRETGLERAVAHRNIPHLVHPEKMLLPIVEDGTFSKFSASMAISVYDRLAAVPKKDRKQSFNKKKFLQLEPLLNADLVKSGIMYSEYRTDDARLTIELIKAAHREGAEAINYMEVVDFIYDQEGITGLKCIDHIDGSNHDFMAKQVVSAAGPWVDLIREEDESKTGKSLYLTKGVHIVVEHDRLPLNHAIYFDDFKGRMLFAIPRGGVTYIGTTDTEYTESLDRVVCNTEDMDYLLHAVNYMFPNVKLVSNDVVSSWAGLRPLIHEEGKSASEISRKDEIFESDRGLISIAGGKLTGYRKMAERVVDRVLDRHDEFKDVSSSTKAYQLHVDSFSDYDEFEMYIANIHEKYKNQGISALYSWYLASTFGKNCESIILSALARNQEDVYAALIKEEIKYCIQYESAIRPDDYFNRRSGKLYFDIKSLIKYFDLIHEVFAETFDWSETKTKEEKIRSQKYIAQVNEIKASNHV